MSAVRNLLLFGSTTALFCALILFLLSHAQGGDKVYVPWNNTSACTKLKEEQLRLKKKVQDMEQYQRNLEEEIELLHSDLEKQKSGHLTSTQSSSDCSAWLKSCEAQCTRTSTSPIPKHVHFISLNRRFSFMEWLAVVTAKKKIKPDKITVYTDGQQDSCWWRRALPYIEHQLIHLLPGSNVLNRAKIWQWAHKADYLRLSILYHYGGIYMDTDSLSLNSFDPLLSNQVVLAKQCDRATAVGVLVAQRHNCFICQFAHRSCQKFKGEWASHSVYTLNDLANEVDKEKEGLVVLPFGKGFFPMCYNTEGLNQLYKESFERTSFFNKTIKTFYKKSDINAVHLYANRAKHLFTSTINNIDWVRNSKSLVAITIRESLPADFSRQHLNTRECANLQLVD